MILRSVTLELPPQRVNTADGLVYDALATVVYRVEDPLRALTAIDDVAAGVRTRVALLVHDLLREQTRATLTARQALDGELTARARVALARWGVTAEQAGLSSVAPTRPTARLTQLAVRVGERARLFAELRRPAHAPALTAALVAAGDTPRGRSAARYRRGAQARLNKPLLRLLAAGQPGGSPGVGDAVRP